MSDSNNPVASTGFPDQPGVLPLLPEFRSLSFWAKFAGVVTIVGGALNFLSGLAAVINNGALGFLSLAANVVLGVVIIISGRALIESSRKLEGYISRGRKEGLEEAFNQTNTYFKINGILVIIGLGLVVLTILLVFCARGGRLL